MSISVKPQPSSSLSQNIARLFYLFCGSLIPPLSSVLTASTLGELCQFQMIATASYLCLPSLDQGLANYSQWLLHFLKCY